MLAYCIPVNNKIKGDIKMKAGIKIGDSRTAVRTDVDVALMTVDDAATDKFVSGVPFADDDDDDRGLP
jgi:hypothetical protein